MPTERSLRRRRRVADAVAVLLGVSRPTLVPALAPTVPDAAALRDAARRISDAIATAGQRDQLRDAHPAHPPRRDRNHRPYPRRAAPHHQRRHRQQHARLPR
jgi:hypothetical protein